MNPPRALFATAAAVVALTACDVPTEPPIFEPRWIIPVDETSLVVDELLPDAVTTVGDDFDVSVDPVSASESLSSLCGAACDALDGMSAPVPGFQGSFVATQSLPSEVLSAEISGGSIDLAITNGFSFDPLENGGSIEITVADHLTGEVLGEIVLDDATYDLTPGSTLFETVDVQEGSITGPLRATTSVEVVGGQTTTIDTSDVMDVTATVQSLLVASVTVDVGSRAVSLDPQEFDLDGVPEEVVERIMSGAIVLDVANPFGVTVDGTLDIGSTSKPFSLDGSSSSTVRIEYTGAELRSFFEQPGIELGGSGTANGTSVTIQPGQEMAIEATVDFTLQIG